MRSSMGYVARILVFLLLLAPFSVAQAPTIQILEGPELGGGEPTGVQLTVKWDAHGNPNYEQVSIHFELVPQEGGSEVSGTFQYQSSPGQDEFSIQFGETAAHAGDTIIVHATFTYSGGDPIPKSAQGEIPEEHEN